MPVLGTDMRLVISITISVSADMFPYLVSILRGQFSILCRN